MRWLVGLLLCVGCGGVDSLPPAPPTCNPVIGDDCLTPFPSSYFEVPADTATGVELALPADILPKSKSGVVVKPDRLNARDGFSPASPFLVYFAAGVDPANLPAQTALAGSVTASSAVQILEYATGARVPLFAELDANAGPGDRRALLVHRMVRLKPATRYVVALVGLKDASGKPLAPAPFAALRDGKALTPQLSALAPRYEEIFAKLSGAGVARAGLSLAWDVVTASDTAAIGHLVGMRDAGPADVD